jgi:hypothetical protein
VSLLSKVLYLCVILLLACLAVLPHWATIKKEAGNIYATWQHVRSPNRQITDAQQPEKPNPKKMRERMIAPPTAPEPVVATTEQATKADTLDPFILEARERAQTDPEAAMQWLQERGTGAERLRGMLEVVALWAGEDSESALLWLESNAQGLARLETLNSGIELWAERDPRAAADWIDGMANDGSKIAAAKSLAVSWGSRDPEKVSAWLKTLPDDEIKATAALALAETWPQKDPRAASLWAFQLAQSSGDVRPLKNSLRQYALENPAGAEAFARQLAEEENNPSGTLAYIQARAEIDPASTVDWLSSLEQSDPFHRSEYFAQYTEAAISEWTKNDSIAASAWLSQQAPSPTRDAAIVGFSESIQRFEPEAAAAWANTLSDPERRMEQLSQSVRSWAENDARAALSWVIGAELEPALQEQLARDIGID